MNNPYKLTLIYLTRISQRSPKGFALAFCLAIGVVMALTGAAMMIRSQGQQTKVLAQESKAQGVSIAGVAVTQIQQLLSDNKFLAEYNSSDWLNVEGKDNQQRETEIYKDFDQASKSCDIQNDPNSSAEKTATQQLIVKFADKEQKHKINPDDPTQGKYKLISYTKPTQIPGLGKLIVQGFANTTGKEDNVKEASSQIVVEIPVAKDTTADAPGLWLKEGDMAKSDGGENKNTVAGDVWLSDCTTNPANIKLTSSTTYTSKYAPIPFPDATYLPAYDINTIPAAQKNDSTGQPNGMEITGNVTLPRTGDTPVTKTINGKSVSVYEYLVKSIDLKQGDSTLTLTVNTYKTTGTVTNTWQVRFYLRGNIEKGGEIKHSCDTSANCSPTNFQIYGYGNLTPPTSNTDYKICTNGNNALEAFIFAPNYTAGAAGAGGGGGNGNNGGKGNGNNTTNGGAGGIKGSVWLKSWNKGQACGSQTSNTVVTQTAKWTELLDLIKVDPPIIQLSSPSRYNTCEFGTAPEDCK